MRKELPIGTRIELPFTTLEVVEEKDRIIVCNDCYFQSFCTEDCNTICNLFGGCNSIERNDKTNVIFKEVSHE